MFSFVVLVQAGMHMVKWKTTSLASSTQISGYACVLYQTVTSLLDETVNMPIKSANEEYMDMQFINSFFNSNLNASVQEQC